MHEAAGLGALGFWLFLATVVVAGIWFESRKRESLQETLRRVVESGQNIDPAIIDKVVAANGGHERKDRDLMVAGLIVMFVAPGLTILGWFLSEFSEKIMGVTLGISILVALVALVGIGLYVAGKVYERWQREDEA